MPDPAVPLFDSMHTVVSKTHGSTEHLANLASPSSCSPTSAPTAEGLRSSRHQHSASAVTVPRPNRRSLRAFAQKKTSSALANLASISTASNPSLRSSASSGSLSKYQRAIDATATITSLAAITQKDDLETATALDKPPQDSVRRASSPEMGDLTDSPLSPLPSPPTQGRPKMRQVASKSIRMTEDGHPFTKEMGELFASLVVTLPMTAHRVRFSKVDETFTSEEAILNLGSLKSSQTHRMPDPKDPSRWVITTAITTFSMPREMARSVCQRFLDARLIESADGRYTAQFTSKGGVWQLTPKGINVLHRWCNRIGVSSPHLESLMNRDHMHLVVLERDEHTDKLSQDKATIELIFRRFAGQDGPNIKPTTAASDSDSVNDYQTGLLGVKMAKERKVMDRVIHHSFTGKAASDWLMDCCTTIDRRETFQLAELFIKHKLMWAVVEDRIFVNGNPAATLYQPTKNAIYCFTERGQKLCGWNDGESRTSSTDSAPVKKEAWASKDSNNTRLNMILHDPALRLLFREFLRSSLCEENLTFYQDVKEFTSTYRATEASGRADHTDGSQETMAGAYALYNAFLAPNAPCELNIDHTLRNRLAHCMVRPLGNEATMHKSLVEVIELFEQAQLSVYKLMSSDSVPKFVRDPRYSQVLREHDFDIGMSGRAYSPVPAIPERSASRSTRIS